MLIVRTKNELKEAIRGLRGQGKRIGLVPTMGALHEGHTSLVEIALANADAAVATIFVNPTQFGANEDFSKYPRTEAEDLRKLEAAGTAVTYIPKAEEIYLPGDVTRVRVPGISEALEGAARPGHFEGVATVVTKLFMQALPDIAVFGEKDYQQLQVIRRFTKDLHIPVEIVPGPTVRETDGLALSSRNRYLSEAERAIAPALHRVLQETAARIRQEGSVPKALEQAVADLRKAGFTKVDYVELRNAETLESIKELEHPARLLAAVTLGTTRLIDNIKY